MDGSQIMRGREGSRRHFLKTAAAAGGAASAVASAPAPAWADPPPSPLPQVTLGKTRRTVSALGMGTSWSVAPGFVQAALYAGVRYIDSSENYESGKAEQVLGEVIERTGMRKHVYLVTKTGRKVGGANAFNTMESRLNGSLERLRTSYVDCYYLHGLSGREIPLLFDPEVKAAFEKFKRAGKIHFCGLSCHDARLPEVVTAAAKCGWIDQIMIQYNYRTMNGDAVRRALDAASRANLGLVAMKSQGGAGSFRESDAAPRFNELIEKGFKKHAAAIKTIFAEERMQVVVSEMTNRDMLRENMAAAADPKLSLRQERRLEEHRLATAHLYCHGCGHHCEPAAGGIAVAEILRYLRYHEVYGKRRRARELYQALPPEARDLASADLAAAAAACPHHLPVVELVRRAESQLKS
jgi:predicted aldo/keto reductase-like oxidoreductase